MNNTRTYEDGGGGGGAASDSVPTRPIPAAPPVPPPPWYNDVIPPPVANAPSPAFPAPPVLAPNPPPTQNYYPNASDQPRIYSQDSGVAPYETLFSDMNFEAYSFYNFYVADEETNDTEALENRNLDDVPRFVKLVWDPAPALDDKVVAALKNEQNAMGRSSAPAAMGAKAGVPETYIINGTVFSPGQLKPPNFAEINNSLANSDLAPGVVQTVVSLPLKAAAVNTGSLPFAIDMDAWHTSPRTRGISVNEFVNQLHNVSNQYFYLPKVTNTNMTKTGQTLYANMFSGQFTANRSTFLSNGFNRITSVNASSPAMSMEGRVSYSPRPGSPIDPIEEIYNQVKLPDPPQPKYNNVRAKFIDLNMGGVVSPEKVNSATDPAHGNAMMGIAQVLPNMVSYSQSGLQNVTRKINLKSFDCPGGVKRREYVGYLIEKYEQVNGVFVLKEIIGVPDKDITCYFDSRVKYGAVYRYRIRSVLRWVRPRDQQALIRQNENSTSDMFSGMLRGWNHSKISLTPNLASYFGSEFDKSWAVAHILDDQPPAPPDQLWIRPDSNGRRIVVSFQPPYNPQRDIYKMTLYRKTINDNSATQDHDWVAVADFDMSQPGFYLDYDVDYYQRNSIHYVYAVTCWSVHEGESTMSEQLSARLNGEVATLGEYNVDFVSSAGVHRRNAMGVFTSIPEKKLVTHVIVKPLIKKADQKTIIEEAKLTFGGQERTGSRILNGSKYVFRIESLDTGEKVDIPVTVALTTQKPLIRTIQQGFYWNQWMRW